MTIIAAAAFALAALGQPQTPVTFNREIAALMFEKCSVCHRPGQAAPFALLSYKDAVKHAKEIGKLTRERLMPPWMPETGEVKFVGERRLADAEIQLIQKWIDAGMPEGAAEDLPKAPVFAGGWMLGKPDLVVEMPAAFSVPAEGADLYRNFVIPLTNALPRLISAMEFQPDNPAVLHHAFVYLDATRQSRRLAATFADGAFPGMSVPESALMPDGHFASWQPGRVPLPKQPSYAWMLGTNWDMVAQLHLKPTGKPEAIRVKIGLFFSNTRPTNQPVKLGLGNVTVDIPAGASNYVLTDTVKLPADVRVLGVLPHAHYLAREMEGYAIKPDGTRQALLHIRQWNFDWQGDYRYAEPIDLPKDTVIHMRYTYDNSEGNPRNPSHPPQRVKYGPNSKDEMAELWFQVVPRVLTQRKLLLVTQNEKGRSIYLDRANYLLKHEPQLADGYVRMATILASSNRVPEAVEILRKAVSVEPGSAYAHYALGILLKLQKTPDEAEKELEQSVRLDPHDYRAHGTLGLICVERQDIAGAERHFREAVKENPEDPVAQDYLQQIEAIKRQQAEQKK